MAPYLLRAEHAVNLPIDLRPSPQDITDWLERTLGSDTVRIERVDETVIEFRSKFSPLDSNRSKDSIAFVANGEIEVHDSPGGPFITVRANPHIWQGLIPIVQPFVIFGWAGASSFLRWGAGFGGVILGGLLLFLDWGNLNTFLTYKVEILRMLRSRPDLTSLAKRSGAA